MPIQISASHIAVREGHHIGDRPAHDHRLADDEGRGQPLGEVLVRVGDDDLGEGEKDRGLRASSAIIASIVGGAATIATRFAAGA